MNSNQVVLDMRDVTRAYPTGNAVCSVSLQIAAGDQVAVVGRSGAGKSTLLHLLAAMDRPTSGEVAFRDRCYSRLSDEELAVVRRQHFGFVFQSDRLIPYLSCAENVALPLMLNGESRSSALAQATSLLAGLDLELFADRRPATLSGGESQRVAIARAVSSAPEVLFADEPTGNLDSKSARMVMELLLSCTAGRTLVVVTHDELVASDLSRRISLEDGRIVGDERRPTA